MRARTLEGEEIPLMGSGFHGGPSAFPLPSCYRGLEEAANV